MAYKNLKDYKLWCVLNAKRLKQVKTAWRKKNAKKIREQCRICSVLWRRRNPDRVKEIRKIYAENHPDASKLRSAKWHKENPEKSKRWEKENVEKRRCSTRRRRALLQSATGSFTAEQWLNLKRIFGNACLGCRRTEIQLLAIGLKLVPDHVLPLSRGGTNDISNIQPLCHGKDGCNNHKGAKHIDFRK